jgi:hypothetical protein
MTEMRHDPALLTREKDATNLVAQRERAVDPCCTLKMYVVVDFLGCLYFLCSNVAPWSRSALHFTMLCRH